MESATVYLLFERHSASIKHLSMARVQEMETIWDRSKVIETLELTSLNRSASCHLPAELIVSNANTLKQLHLGNNVNLAKAYVAHHSIQSAQTVNASDFATYLKSGVVALRRSLTVLPCLQQLTLTGFDVDQVALGSLGVRLCLHSLKSLILESCSGVEQAFISMLECTHCNSGNSGNLQLEALKIRHENATPLFQEYLWDFLKGFSGLKRLELMLEGPSHMPPAHIQSIFRVHGRTLSTLLWDQRTGPRTSVNSDTSLSHHSLLGLVARKCPKIQELGLNINWSRMLSSQGHHQLVRDIMIQLSLVLY